MNCSCGCGAETRPGSLWIKGHHLRCKTPEHTEKVKAALPKARAARMNFNKGVCFLSDQDIENARARWMGPSNPKWNRAGRYLGQEGYVWVRNEYGVWVQEHRQIAEQTLGRPLRDDEVVHHLNEIKSDNRRNNLLICTDSYHKLLHTILNTYHHGVPVVTREEKAPRLAEAMNAA